jgi:hypothetical protein
MTNQRETCRELLLELKDAAEFDEVLLDDERALAGDDVAPDPLAEVLGRPGVRARLARIAGELLPREQREHLGVDPLDVRAVLELRDGHVLARRRAYALCIAEMLRRLDAGYSARPPLAEDMFPGRAPASTAPTADSTVRTKPAACEPDAGRDGVPDSDVAALAALRGHFVAASEKANWCSPDAERDAVWLKAATKPAATGDGPEPAAPAATDEGAARALVDGVPDAAPDGLARATPPASAPSARRGAAPSIAPNEIRSRDITDSKGQRVPGSTVQSWMNRGLLLDGSKTPTKLVALRKLPGGERVFDRELVARFRAHSERAKAEKGPAI